LRRLRLRLCVAQRSLRLIPASPLDKVAYFSTFGAGISLRRNASLVGAAPERREGQGDKQAARRTLATSLVLLPDEKGWDLVQEIRLAHDRKVRMWPPHITKP
jgi:hypothetical protein